jgi:predicted ATP-grasp superfamily ATP-dependent carboligase
MGKWNKCKSASILVGFADIGITPIITTSSLIEQLNLPQIGFLKSKTQPPSAIIRSGQPSHSIRIFGNAEIIIVNSDHKFKKQKIVHSLIDSVIKIAHLFESKMIYSTEGVPVETVERIERKEMQFLTTNAEMGDKIASLGHKVLDNAVVAGISGGLLAECSLLPLLNDGGSSPDFCLILAPTCSLYPDVWSSVMIIQLLNSLLNTTSDTSNLEASARKLEAKANVLINIHKKPAHNDLYL